MKICFLVFFASILSQFSTLLGQTNCSRNAFGRGNTFYIFSDKQINAFTAQSTCSRAGGVLAHVDVGELQQELISFFEQRILSEDLDTVTIYKSTSFGDTFKYRASKTPNNDSEMLNPSRWIVPPRGNLSSIKLFMKPTEEFSSRVVFCHFQLGDVIGSCMRSFLSRNFVLYGGSNGSSGATPIFNFFNGTTLSSFLLLSHQIPENNQYNLQKQSPVVYVPGYESEFPNLKVTNEAVLFYKLTRHNLGRFSDISIFIGARSLPNQSDWFWNNGTMIQNDEYGSSNASLCQQMSWPLTYSDGINLQPKLCSDDAHFLCQFKFAIEVTPVQCNGTILRVSWNLTDFELITTQQLNLFVRLRTSRNTDQIGIFANSFGIISGLAKNTSYTVQASVEMFGCEEFSVTTSSTGTTSHGIPDPVMNARVLNNTNTSSHCVIEWDHDPSNTNISYKITASNQRQSFEVNIRNPTLGNEIHSRSTIQQMIDLAVYPPNATFQFQIRAFSCEGNSEAMAVIGSCRSTAGAIASTPVFSKSSMYIIVFVAVPVAVVLIGLLIVFLAIFIKRKCNLKENRISNELLPVDDMEMNEADSEDWSQVEDEPKQNIYDDVPDLESNEETKEDSNALYQNVHLSPNGSAALQLKKYYISEAQNCFENIKKEFKEITVKSASNEPEHQVASDPKNIKKNRYKNIYPYDHARVTLSNGKYINASYIEGYKDSRSYIATQGPKPSTIEDFWEMVWMEKPSMIVMLCNCVENEKKKCELYWPPTNVTNTYGEIKVEEKSEENLGGIMKRTFGVQKIDSNEEQRQLVQFHFVSWPDHDIPLTTSGMVRLRKMVNHQHSLNQSSAPILIHCSAGSGRTGTYIAIDNLIEEHNETGEVDVDKTVMKMRKNRKDMVQNENQYIFVFKLLLENLLLKETEMSAKTLPKVVALTKDWNDYVVQEHRKLFVLSPDESPEVDENIYQNISPHILSSDVNRVFLKYGGRRITTDAHIIENDRYSSCFIATSGPQRRKEEEFIEIILQCNSKIVVCLEFLESDFLRLDQRQDGDVIKAGKYVITVNHVTDCNDYALLTSTVSDSTTESEPTPITMIFLRSWPELLSPPNSSCLAEVMEKVKASMELNQPSTAMVYCRDGCSRTGAFLVFANLLEQLKCNCLNNQTVDVFRTVKDLREMRPGMVDTLDQYKLSYSIIKEYLSCNPV